MASRARRWWGPGLTGALAVHAALAIAVVLSVRIVSPQRELPPVIVRLQQLAPQPEPAKPVPRRQRPLRPPSKPAIPAAPPPIVLPAVPPSPAPQPPTAAAPPRDEALENVRRMLRTAVGCADAGLYHLTPEELARCRGFERAQVDPDLHLPLAIDPAKRSEYEAAQRDAAVGQRMPMGAPGVGLRHPFDPGK